MSASTSTYKTVVLHGTHIISLYSTCSIIIVPLNWRKEISVHLFIRHRRYKLKQTRQKGIFHKVTQIFVDWTACMCFSRWIRTDVTVTGSAFFSPGWLLPLGLALLRKWHFVWLNRSSNFCAFAFYTTCYHNREKRQVFLIKLQEGMKS